MPAKIVTFVILIVILTLFRFTRGVECMFNKLLNLIEMKLEKLNDSILVDELKSNDFSKIFGGCTPDDEKPKGVKMKISLAKQMV